MDNTSQATDSCCSRQTGRGLLEDKALSLEYDARSLRIISDALPKELTPEQDQALWHITISLHRK